MDLVKTIQNDPAKMTKLFVLVENMVKRYQNGHTVEVDMQTCPSNSSGTNGIVTTITCPLRNATTMVAGKRLRKGMMASQFLQADDDDDTLPQPKTKPCCSCKLCRCSCHR
jgi:hypothetical protein